MTAARGAELLGLDAGMVVQELGWDEDTDPDLRDEIMDAIDADMIEDAIEAVDVVVLWWREDDGDVVDGLVDAMKDLAPTGFIWLLTPQAWIRLPELLGRGNRHRGPVPDQFRERVAGVAGTQGGSPQGNRSTLTPTSEGAWK